MELLLLEWQINEFLQDRYPMHYAARKGNVDIMKVLITRGFTVNCMTFELLTPLHEASSKGHIPAVKFLINEGAWINARNIDGATPLCVACTAGQTEIARILIENQASIDPTVLIDPTNSPLHESVIRGHVSCVKLLIAKGAKLNAYDRQNGTPLHAACSAYKSNMECVLSLIQAGSDVNATMFHKSPLHIAASRNLYPVVQLLLNYGADVYLRDNAGKSAKDLAKSGSAVHQLLNRYEIHPRSLADCCRMAILRHFVVSHGDSVNNRRRMIESIGLPNPIVQFIFNFH